MSVQLQGALFVFFSFPDAAGLLAVEQDGAVFSLTMFAGIGHRDLTAVQPAADRCVRAVSTEPTERAASVRSVTDLIALGTLHLAETSTAVMTGLLAKVAEHCSKGSSVDVSNGF